MNSKTHPSSNKLLAFPLWAWQQISSANAMVLSFLGHFFFAGGIAWLLFAPRERPPKTVDIQVINAPAPTKPIQAIQTAEKPKAPSKTARPVFGISKKTATDEGSSVAVKAGNTVAKAPDQEKLRPEDEQGLPVPTDEYLVSRMPEPLSEFRAPYPLEAKQKGIQGAVILEILVDSDGNVRDAKVIEGPGAGLNEAALEAIKRFRFKPALVEDKPVAVRIRYAYRFVLEK